MKGDCFSPSASEAGDHQQDRYLHTGPPDSLFPD